MLLLFPDLSVCTFPEPKLLDIVHNLVFDKAKVSINMEKQVVSIILSVL